MHLLAVVPSMAHSSTLCAAAQWANQSARLALKDVLHKTDRKHTVGVHYLQVNKDISSGVNVDHRYPVRNSSQTENVTIQLSLCRNHLTGIYTVFYFTVGEHSPHLNLADCLTFAHLYRCNCLTCLMCSRPVQVKLQVSLQHSICRGELSRLDPVG